MAVSYERSMVPVEGGQLCVGRWGDADTAVIASHGITANHLSWQRIGELVVERSGGGISLVAVDHRGRAGSANTPGPYGLAQHAADLVAVLQYLGQPSAVLAGHSMGAFVATVAAEHHPDRFDGLVLVDGGLPLPLQLPADIDVEAVVRSVIGPALDRLDLRWPDEDAYVDFFVQHPAFQPPNGFPPSAEAYVRYDAVRTAEGEIRSSARKEAVFEDGGAAIVDPEASKAIERITTPTTLLWAPRGLLDQIPGLYTDEVIEAAVAALPHLCATLVDDCNHYTIAVGEAGATTVANAILAAVHGP